MKKENEEFIIGFFKRFFKMLMLMLAAGFIIAIATNYTQSQEGPKYFFELEYPEKDITFNGKQLCDFHRFRDYYHTSLEGKIFRADNTNKSFEFGIQLNCNDFADNFNMTIQNENGTVRTFELKEICGKIKNGGE